MDVFRMLCWGVNTDLFAMCTKGHDEKKNREYPTPHDFMGTITTLRDMFPYPLLYTRLTSCKAQMFGENYLKRRGNMNIATFLLSKAARGKEGMYPAHANGQNRRFSDNHSVSLYR